MFQWIKRLVGRLNDAADRMEHDALTYATDPIQVTFSIPGAPPAGRKVAARNGMVYQRRDATPAEAETFSIGAQQWGMWEPISRDEYGNRLSTHWYFWYALLAEHGPVTLLPEDVDPEETRLYGPPGARWGDP